MKAYLPWLCATAFRTLVMLSLFGALSCGSSGGERLSLSSYAVGETPASFDSGQWKIELTQSDVAFAPLYLCTSEAANPEYCSSALLELRDVIVIDTLDSNLQYWGEADGLAGNVHSGFFDYGASWLLTESAPRYWETELGDYSLVVVGMATSINASFSFELRVKALPSYPGSPVVSSYKVEQELSSALEEMQVHINTQSWIESLDFDELAEEAASSGGTVVVDENHSEHEVVLQSMQSGYKPSLSFN